MSLRTEPFLKRNCVAARGDATSSRHSGVMVGLKTSCTLLDIYSPFKIGMDAIKGQQNDERPADATDPCFGIAHFPMRKQRVIRV